MTQKINKLVNDQSSVSLICSQRLAFCKQTLIFDSVNTIKTHTQINQQHEKVEKLLQ